MNEFPTGLGPGAVMGVAQKFIVRKTVVIEGSRPLIRR